MKSTTASSNNNIVPACFAETILLQTIGYECRKNHQGGDNKAIGSMEKASVSKIIALMDKPEGISPVNINPKYRDLETADFNLILKKRISKHHYIIYINKVMEEWIYELAKSAGIKTYASVEKLKRELKPSSALTNRKIRKYFNELYYKNPKPFQTIDNWIKKLNK